MQSTIQYVLSRMLFVVLLIASQLSWAQQSISGTFNSGGVSRWYGGALPQSPNVPLRLVLLFPGTTENTNEMLMRDYNDYLGTNSMVVYPESFDRMVGINGTDSIDDFQMVQDLIDDVRSKYSIDTADICIGGFSSGATFCYQLLCEYNTTSSPRPYRFRAIAAVSGSIPEETLDPIACPLIGPIPLIAFHGTADVLASYYGGDTLSSGSISLNTDSAIADWSQHINSCTTIPTTTSIPDSIVEQFAPSTVTSIMYSCPTTQTHLYRVNDGRHSWPSGTAFADFFGANQDIIASKLIADFFNATRSSSLGSIEPQESQFIISPNPASHTISIERNEQLNKVELYDVSGKKVHHSVDGFETIHIDHLPQGVYTAILQSKSQITTQKLIKL